MMTNQQLGFIHQARKQAGIADDGAWRLLLWNTARVNSSKHLDQAGFEKVLAVLEQAGFRDTKRAGDYWRTKAASAGTRANERIVRKIGALASGQKYCLAGLVDRVSKGRTRAPEKLTPKEAHNLVEALKDLNRRAADKPEGGDYPRLTDDQIGEFIDKHNVSESLFEELPV